MDNQLTHNLVAGGRRISLLLCCALIAVAVAGCKPSAKTAEAAQPTSEGQSLESSQDTNRPAEAKTSHVTGAPAPQRVSTPKLKAPLPTYGTGAHAPRQEEGAPIVVKVVEQISPNIAPQPTVNNLVVLRSALPAPIFGGTPKALPAGVEPITTNRVVLMVPEDVINLASGAKMSSSDINASPEKLAKIADGDKEASSAVLLRKGSQYVQFDLGALQELYAIIIWHGFDSVKVYHDVVVQVADDRDFVGNVRTLFNNDQDNSLGLGVGTDREYVESHMGKLIDTKGTQARVVRLYSKGSTDSSMNEYTEVEIFGRPVK